MANRLRALTGPLQGQEFTIKQGLSMGRAKGEIRLDDVKVSSLHAFVTSGPKGSFILTDNGSKNGIRVGDSKVGSVALSPGVKFTVGDSTFEVILGPEEEEASRPRSKKSEPQAPPLAKIEAPTVKLNLQGPPTSESAPEPPPPATFKAPQTQAAPVNSPVPDSQGAAVPPPAAAAPKKDEKIVGPMNLVLDPGPLDADAAGPEGRKWHDVLAEFADEAATKITDQPRAVVPFQPPLKLTFIGGIQAETEWIVGYGPRRAGSQSVDLPIFEPGAPEICFELMPAPEGVTFRTNHSKSVHLNGAEAKLQVLKSGDIIAIGATQIEVEFLK